MTLRASDTAKTKAISPANATFTGMTRFRNSGGRTVLQSARNVTYKSFLAPGKVLDLTCECREMSEQKSVFSASGRVGDREIVKARLTLAHRTLAESNPSMADVDERIRGRLRSRLDLLQVGGSAQAAVSCA